MDVVNDWLMIYQADSRNKKSHNLMSFCDWLGKTPQEVLELRKQDMNRTFEKLVIKFLHYLIEERKLQLNTAITKIGTIRSFFNFNDLPLRFKRNDIPKVILKPHKFSLTIDHVRHMWHYANIWQKTIIIVAVETGLRVSDILALKKVDIENMLQQKPPANMEVQTRKEGVLARIHLSNEAMKILKLYLPTILNNECLFEKDVDTLNKAIQKLFRTAFPNIQAKITFHDFRRLFISTATNLGVNEWHIKYMCGKKIPNDILTYLRNLDFEKKFLKIKSRLTIQQRQFLKPESKTNLNAILKALLPLVEEKLIEQGIVPKK